MILAYRYTKGHSWGSPLLKYNFCILRDTFMPLYRYKIDLQTTLQAEVTKP